MPVPQQRGATQAGTREERHGGARVVACMGGRRPCWALGGLAAASKSILATACPPPARSACTAATPGSILTATTATSAATIGVAGTSTGAVAVEICMAVRVGSSREWGLAADLAKSVCAKSAACRSSRAIDADFLNRDIEVSSTFPVCIHPHLPRVPLVNALRLCCTFSRALKTARRKLTPKDTRVPALSPRKISVRVRQALWGRRGAPAEHGFNDPAALRARSLVDLGARRFDDLPWPTRRVCQLRACGDAPTATPGRATQKGAESGRREGGFCT